MKKNVVMILLIMSFIAMLYSCYIDFDISGINILLATGVLLYLTPKIDIIKHKYLWKGIKIYTVSSVYLIIFIFLCDYIDLNNIQGMVLIMPGALGALISMIYVGKNIYKILKSKNGKE